MGFGNENWRLRDTDGSCYVLKIGDSGNGAKWRSSHVALELAQAAGLQVPRFILGELGGVLVRIFTWIDGETATKIQPGTDKSERLLGTTGAAVRTLHTVARDSFSSRLDGSTSTFSTWRAYVDHRLTQIRSRCEDDRSSRTARCSTELALSLLTWQRMSTAAPRRSSAIEISTPTTSSWTPKAR